MPHTPAATAAAPAWDETDEAFLAALAEGTVPDGAFHHRDHVRLAWLRIRALGLEPGTARIREDVRGFAARKGLATLYHETLTTFWARAVASALAGDPGTAGFAGFVARHPELLDKDLPRRHYRPESLTGETARREWVAPDVRPLP